MVQFSLPVAPDIADQIFDVDLDGVTFRFELHLNSRDGAWFLNIFTTDGTLLRAGLRLVNDWTVILRWRDFAVRPAGILLVINSGALTEPPTLGELGPNAAAELIYEGET